MRLLVLFVHRYLTIDACDAELRRHIQLEQLKWSRPMTAASGATSTPQASREGSLNDGEPHQPHRPGSVNLSTQDNSLRGSRRGSRSAGGNHTAPSSARSFKGCMPPIRILNPSSGQSPLPHISSSTFPCSKFELPNITIRRACWESIYHILYPRSSGRNFCTLTEPFRLY